MAKSVKRPAESWTYMLASDRALPLEQQTRFTLRPMTIGERAAAWDDLVRELRNDDGTRTLLRRTRQQGVELAIRHIVSIENFPVGAAQPWPADAEQRARYLELLEDRDVSELADEIWKRSNGVDDSAKNFLPPERTSDSGGASPAIQSSTAASDAISNPA
jgi:hypothetical protein